MGDGEKAPLRLQFNPIVRLEFHGSTITSDAGLLAFRELDDALDLTGIASNYLQESRTGRNILHHLVPLLRQSIYSRLAGYDDTNDAVRLSKDPAMRVVVACSGSDHNAASTSEMGRFETETLTEEPEGAGSDEFPMGGGCHGSYSTPASNPGYGQFRESGARSAGGSRLQRPLRVCLLSPSLSVQPVRGLRSSDATARQRPQCR